MDVGSISFIVRRRNVNIGRVQMAKNKPILGTVDLKTIRRAVANYMYSEGCACCRGSDHDKHKAVLAKLLRVSKYSDGSGYDFSKFREGLN
jgi:hypothetical protein